MDAEARVISTGLACPRSRSIGVTAAVNNTTVASNGNPVTLISDTFNVQGGWYWLGGDVPGSRATFDDGYPYVNASQYLVVRPSAPTDSPSMNGTIVFEEIGKAGN